MIELFKYIGVFSLIFYNFRSIVLFYPNFFGLNYQDSLSFISKIVSVIHSIYICRLSQNLLDNTITNQEFIDGLVVSKAYFIYDLIMIPLYFYDNKECMNMVIHHIVLLLGLNNKLVYIQPKYYAMGLMAEITNPFLYLGWYLLKKNRGV